MEVTEIISFDKDSLSDETKENIYEALIELTAENVSKKNLRKLLEICLVVLRFKGNQCEKLQKITEREIESAEERTSKTSTHKKLSEENARQKKIISRLENEKASHKAKIKELNEEIFDLQKALQESNFAGSEKEDSSDPLSELDKQEELMRNIDSKNKHIKRLLRNLEVLEKHNLELNRKVRNHNEKLDQATSEIGRLTDILSNIQDQNEGLKDSLTLSNTEISRLESNIKFLEDEKDKVESGFRIFLEKLEQRALGWKKVLDDKENQLESLRKKYEDLYVQQANGTVVYGNEAEVQRLVEAMKERDSAIEQLENRLRSMTDEMISSTNIMNEISNQRETETSQEPEKGKPCCKSLEEALALAHERAKELAGMIENIEEDNVVKSKQAAEAINALQAYETGEDGLEKALRKISNLQSKVASRDKQIKALVMEINSLHELGQENRILRERLNIPEDVVISTKNLLAKERSKDKMIERLKLKLHAAEESYLALKIEKSQLKKEVFELKSGLHATENGDEAKTERLSPMRKRDRRRHSFCENCLKSAKLNEEIFDLQKALQESNFAGSEKEDSSDPLSELDKQEELMRNIDSKNKHIKRLLRNLEVLEKHNLELNRKVRNHNEKLDQATSEIGRLTDILSNIQDQNEGLKDSLTLSNTEISRLESNIKFLEDEKDKVESGFRIFLEKLEQRALGWKKVLDDKENQLESLRKKYEDLYVQQANGTVVYGNEAEVQRLVEAMKERDSAIEQLENRLRSMTDEMISSTNIMNEISNQRETETSQEPEKGKPCCKSLEEALALAHERAKELAGMIENIEEDNVVKSKQAAEAINALQAYETGEDGLEKALRKISNLQSKVASRDKQIKALVMEINSLHELGQENRILRERLNIPEDVVISTKNLLAKERSKDKMIERLKLKLHAAEESYLALKIEKSQLKKEVFELKSGLHATENGDEAKTERLSPMRKCDRRRHSFCENCLKSAKDAEKSKTALTKLEAEWEEKYLSVIEENENLRVGMHEILEQIREYDAHAEHVVIDCRALEEVLHALDARSISGWYHPAMRIQNELIAVKERAHVLKEQMLLRDKLEILKANLERKGSRGKSTSVSSLEKKLEADLKDGGESQTRSPTKTARSRRKSSAEELISSELDRVKERYREVSIQVEELKCYKQNFEELTEGLKASKDKMEAYCSELAEKLNESDKKFKLEQKKYAFLKEDYAKTIEDLKNTEMSNLSAVAELRKELNAQRLRAELLRSADAPSTVLNEAHSNGMKELQKECIFLKDKLADLINQLYSDKIENYNPPLNENLESFINYAIIKDDFQLDVITIEEFDLLKKECRELTENMETMKIKYKQLEDLLAIEQDQIKSQQKLLADVTDTQIDLRHLIADLQASNEDKYIIAKTHRDLEIVKQENEKLKNENEKFRVRFKSTEMKINEQDAVINKMKKTLKSQDSSKDVKLNFLKKSLYTLQSKYIKYTPLILLCDFVSTYVTFMKKSNEKDEEKSGNNLLKEFEEETMKRLNTTSSPDSKNVIKLIKYETKNRYLEEQIEEYQQKIKHFQKELDNSRLASVENNEHWKTINALFGEDKSIAESASKYAQASIDRNDASTNTEEVIESGRSSASDSPARTFSITSPKIKLLQDANGAVTLKSLESQLKQAMNLASTRSTLLLETENRLAEAQGRIKEMERTIESKNALLKQRLERDPSTEAEEKNMGLVETTISSLQSLLSEKDTTLMRYQELLKAEREQHSKSCETYEKEITVLKKANQEMDVLCKAKEAQLEIFKRKVEELEKNSENLSSNNLDDCEKELRRLEVEENLNEISDEKIEEMFLDEQEMLDDEGAFSETIRQAENEISTRQIQHLQNQLRDLNSREMIREKALCSKEEEIENLKQKVTILQEREKLELAPGPEIEQLRILLEEKDKHINDLMETLSSFHDDQQRLINETSFYSANQVQQLGSDLQRMEAANRILNAQIEALRRQVASLTNREKQSRDLANSLKNQLIKRPVVSMKSELNTRTKNEQLQKRVNQLEIELEEAKQEIRKQLNVAELRRAKNAADLALWEKQKRWQQNAEKLRTKLTETEATLEKTKMWLSSAKNTIGRLEREKQALELRLRGSKCCRTPSCPNLLMTKYNVAETPDSFNESDESSAPARDSKQPSVFDSSRVELSDNNQELINALKARIETQQRRIVTLELEGKGSNALTTELEKLQEKISDLQAQNIRLEAKNLQLQLDIDMMGQSNDNERLHRRIKYLEDYTMALKEDLSKEQSDANKKLERKDDKRNGTVSHTNLEQTVLALRRIVEKLRVENKNLRTRQIQAGKAIGGPCELSKLQMLYTEALDKIAGLEIELQLRDNVCHVCKGPPSIEAGGDLAQELKLVKEKLRQKSQLLEKAKILLTRAAAKEKNLKDQLSMWKRKCSELKNVPVIDEISE